MRRIDVQFLETPFFGARQMARWLRRQGYDVNRKRVGRLMRKMGLSAIYQKPNTSKPFPGVRRRIEHPRLRSVCAGIGGQFAPEWLVSLDRNQRSVWSGMGGQFGPEYAVHRGNDDVFLVDVHSDPGDRIVHDQSLLYCGSGQAAPD